jgi:poly-gamma-glutamate capsule biosynthesis protein CapA/YwtB (metallophosphatase superfamily)
MVSKRPLVFVALATLALVVVWATGATRSARAETAVRVTTTLPRWAAPGAQLHVRGWTAPKVTVKLWIGRRVRFTRSGPRGRFDFRRSAPAHGGRYPVAVVAQGMRTDLGALRVRPLLLAAVGDVTFGDGVRTAIQAYGARYPWRSVARVLRSADVAVANLEGAVSNRGAPWPGKQYTFRGPPSALRAAGSYAGLDAVSVANNHSLDFGRVAFLDTLRHARRSGIVPFGGGADPTAARRPAILTAGNLRVAFAGFSDVRPLGWDAGVRTPGTAPAFSDVITAVVRAAGRRADVVVAYFHWGVERSAAPNARQRDLARTAFAAGAEVVLGAHPHVLQPIERDGPRLVAWSLGNFVFAASSPNTERTGILRLRLGTRGVLGWGIRHARIAGVQPRLVG